MTTTLITGANKGLGRETARQLIIAGHDVWVGARDEERGKAAARQIGGRFVALDVTSDTSVNAAAELIESHGGLDVLINNAGIERRLPDNTVISPALTTADDVATLFETNVFGLVRVTHAFLPLLERSPCPVVVNVSSGLGSLTQLGNHFYRGIAYPASKTAVNAITVQLAKALPRFRINAADPGFTKTDLNGRTGTQTVEEGAEIIVRMAQIGADGPTCAFLSARGLVPWEKDTRVMFHVGIRHTLPRQLNPGDTDLLLCTGAEERDSTADGVCGEEAVNHLLAAIRKARHSVNICDTGPPYFRSRSGASRLPFTVKSKKHVELTLFSQRQICCSSSRRMLECVQTTAIFETQGAHRYSNSVTIDTPDDRSAKIAQ